MITVTGNRVPLLKTASRDTTRESVATPTFFSPSARSHAINFTSLSIPKSSGFHAMVRLIQALFGICLEKQFIFQHSVQASVPPTPLRG